MVKARRAKARPSRVLVPLLAVVVAAEAVLIWQVRADDDRDTVPLAVASATATPTPGAASTSPGEATAQLALQSCRERVAAADAVLATAATGVGHWAAHVQAQTDADAGEITVDQMNTIFTRSRLAGSGDEKRYQRARTAYQEADGSCAFLPDAPAPVAEGLSACRTRAAAQRPVLAAAEPAMADWREHLQDMRASRMQHVRDADQVWVRAWRAAPPHIEAYQDAVEAFDAPRC